MEQVNAKSGMEERKHRLCEKLYYLLLTPTTVAGVKHLAASVTLSVHVCVCVCVCVCVSAL